MRAAVLALILTVITATPALPQAWLSAKGETTVSFVVSDAHVKQHNLSGVNSPGSNINTQSLLADVTYGIRDNLSITVSLPIVRTRFISLGTPPHPTIQDNGQYHTTVTDLRFDLRYSVVDKRGFVVTPFVTTVTPAHEYQYFAHAAPGRRVNEVQFGTYVGKTLDGLLPGMFVQARYGYGVQEQFLDISHNRSVYSVESGYFVTPDIRVFGMLNGQVTHGGVNLTPTSRLTWPEAMWLNHDRIVHENFNNFGAGLGWSLNDTVDVFGSYTKMFKALNTHVLDHALIFGASIRIQKSAIERGIVSSNLGNRIARCACQKGLAAKR